MNRITITEVHLTSEDAYRAGIEDSCIALSDAARERVTKCYEYLKQKVNGSDEIYYGINTGFGKLCDVRIDEKSLTELQENLVRSHACGLGEPVPLPIVRTMLLLKIVSLSKGYSGISPEVLDRLIDMYNEDVMPVIFEMGSLGASGDLAPLAHLSLPLLGSGEVWFKGARKKSSEVITEYGWQPISLQPKEGLALLNGTQFMSSYGCFLVENALRLYHMANACGSLSLDCFGGKAEPFNALLHTIRPHRGQQTTATAIGHWLTESELQTSPGKAVQDPYSMRCIPQVHGASLDAFIHIKNVIETEINSVTDNPNVFPDEDLILSGGNFHGQPLAMALDYLAIALAELGSISERRTYLLLSGERGLPPFLATSPGLQSGLMIAQYTAASLVSENKQLATPASVDSITSSNGQEDHVSMGANAATKCLRILHNLENILAIEWFTACQALDFRTPLKTGHLLQKIYKTYREGVTFADIDREFYVDINNTRDFLSKTDFSNRLAD